MKALILNSGLGSRMGEITKVHPKCMTDIPGDETILSRQLRLLSEIGVDDIIITTGYYDQVLIDYCNGLNLPLNIKFVKNPVYDKTNYIYSIYCAKEDLMDEDIILMHGDLVFQKDVLEDIVNSEKSCMKVSSTLPLPEKDFKSVVIDGHITKVGVEFFENAYESQALYKLNADTWNIWLNKIIEFVDADKVKCYAETAFNEISDECIIYPFDVEDRLCSEIDNPEDLEKVSGILKEIENL